IFTGETYGASSVSALARAKAGAVGSAATTPSNAAASAWPVQAEWKASAYFCQPLRFRSVPGLDRGRGPLRRFVGVAVVAGIGRAELCRQVGTRDAEAVIVPPVDDHIAALRHVAGRAGERRACRLMMVVCNGPILVGGVALEADAIPVRAKFGAMG